MKVITIGRGEDNQIVLEDNQDLISRQHATLRIHETGKMEIVSTGSNGTFVNGFRIKSNVPYKVTRKDVISFAHVRQLDWALVPDPFRFIRMGIIGAVIAIVVSIAILLWPEKKPVPPIVPDNPVIQVDPANDEKPKAETPKEESKETPKEKGKNTPTKRFPTKDKDKKKKEKEEEEKKKQSENKDEEVKPQNQAF